MFETFFQDVREEPECSEGRVSVTGQRGIHAAGLDKTCFFRRIVNGLDHPFPHEHLNIRIILWALTEE